MNTDIKIYNEYCIDLSVVITTHNRATLLQEAIESVLAQDSSGLNVELIVVDDNSMDKTSEIVAQYPEVQYIRTKQGSASGSRNIGIAAAKGCWIAFLDDDDVWVRHKLQCCAQVIHDQPDVRLIVSGASICTMALQQVATWSLRGKSDFPDYLDVFDEQVITPSAMLCHRDVFNKVGLFDTSVPRAEDRDFFMRAALCGYNAFIIAEPLILYRVRDRPNAKELYETYLTTDTVMRRYLTAQNGIKLMSQYRVMWKLRGWYAFHMLNAVQHVEDRSLSWKFRWLAFTISPLHWLKFHVIAR